MGQQRTLISILFIALMGVAMPSHALLPEADAQGHIVPSLAPMLEQVSPAVVNIATTARVRQRNPLLEDPFFKRFFNLPNQPQQERRTTSAGSGVIVDAREGYVLTNAHVIDGAEQVEITLKDGRSFTAEVIGVDREVDLAVVQVEADGEDLSEITIADSTGLRVGDFVIAIGNPFGLGQTVTSGIVSALGRTGLGIEGYENFIQTDASINPGNSGGALVNLRGELIGINTAIIAPAGGNVGIGFAIPTEMAVNVMQQLIEHGEVRRGVLGVTIQDLSPELAEAFGIERQRGVVITQVMDDSAASDAGLEAGDVVVEVDGVPVKRSSDLRNKVGLSPVGERVTLKVIRDGKARKVEAVIRETSELTASGADVSQYLEGASLRNLREGELPHASAGVLVESVEQGSPAWRAGVRTGDVIINANRQEISDMESLAEAIPEKDDGILLRINRNGGIFFVVIR
ncbi:MAG: DegQ family serine endoprotease [Alcanivoracaceae bacterium]